MRKLSILTIFFFLFSNLFSFESYVFATWFSIESQKVSLDTSSSFTNQQDSLWVNPLQEFRYESSARNTTWNSLSNINYYSSFPTWIIYNTSTTAARQINWWWTYVIPTWEFNPTSQPNYLNSTSTLTDTSLYQMRRILLKFPSNWSIYENTLSNYFTADWWITSDTKITTIWVNVRPHITDYYFEKNDWSQTTNQVQWSNSESINLVLKVKDYNSCSNISGWTVQADLSSLWLSTSESLSYVSCDSDWNTAIFKKIWITTNSSLWDYIFDVSKFSATDSDWNVNTPNDSNTTFDDEDKKSSITLTIVPSLTPVISLLSLSDSLIWWPEKLSSTLQVSSTSSWSIKAVVWWNSSCTNWTVIEDWSLYTQDSTKSFTINSNSLSEWSNNIVVCLANNWYTWSLTKEIDKDSTLPIISSLSYTSNVALNDGSVSFNCNENWYFAWEIWWNGTYWSWTWTLTWTSSSAWVTNSYTLQNSLLNTWANSFYIYCKDNASNISFSTWSVTKTIPILSMSWMINSFSDNDFDNNWLDWKDISITWQKPSWDISNFYAYQLYILPSNISFNSSLYWNNFITYIQSTDTTSYIGTSNITTDSIWNALVSWGSYKACIVIRWNDWLYWIEWCSSPAILTYDIVQNAKILSAKFTSDTNLEITTDATLDTNLSSHSWTLISYVYNWVTYYPLSISNINWTKINLTIQPLWDLWAVWSNILMQTWAIHSNWWWYNNYFSSWTLVISDWQSPTITWFSNNTLSTYNSFYSWSINVWFTFAEQMATSWNTRIVFDRVSWNNSSQKTLAITTSSNLTPWSKTKDLTLSWLLVSWTNYNMYLYWEDLARNSVTSNWVTVKFDNVWPTQTTLNHTSNTSSTTPTLSWNSPTDDSWNGSWIWSYSIRIYNNSDCSWTPIQSLTSSTTSKSTNSLSNWTYSWNVYAIDNVWNIWITSNCDSFLVDTSIATISNLSITDTTLNSTSFTKSWNSISITASLSNTNSWKITADLSALTWNATHTGVLCSSPVSWVSCSYTSSIVTYTFNVAFAWSVAEAVRQATLYVSNVWWTQSANSTSSITVDNTAPTSWTISSPSWTIWWNTTNIAWSWISDSNFSYLKFEYSLNSWSTYNLISTWSNVSPYSWDISSLTSWSNYKIKITAYDKSGNQTIITSSNFTIDKDWPNISWWLITSPSSWSYIKWSSNYTLTWDSSKITDAWGLSSTPVSLYYSTNSWSNWNLIASSLPNNWSYNWSIPSINSSNVKLQIVATDNVWNTSSYVTPYSFTIDSTLPTFTIWISTPPNWVYINSNWFNIEWVSNDTNLKSISYSFKRVSDNFYWNWSTYTWAISWNTLQDNISWISFNTNTLISPSISNWETYDLVIKASDYAGNDFTTIARRYTWDSINPTITINTSSWTYFLDNLTISWSSSDAWAWISSVKISIMKWSQYWDGTNFVSSWVQLSTNTSNNYSNWNYTFNVPSIENNWQNYQIILYAYDSSYKVNNSSSSSIGITLDKASPNIPDDIFTFNTSNLYIWWNVLNITWNTSNITDTWAWLKTNPIKLEYFNDPNWILISDNLPNNWSYNFTLPQIDVSNARIRISASDKVGNISYKNSSSFIIDSTPPTISSIETMDLWASWKIDALKVIMSENIKDSTITLWNFSISDWIWAPTWVITWNDIDDNIFILTFSWTWNTSLKPKLTYTSWTLTDIAWKNLASISNVSSIDKAVPRILSAEGYDSNSNWKLDRVKVNFSENISSTTDISAFSITSKNILSSSVSWNISTILIDEWTDFDTTTNSLTLSFISNSNWTDTAGNLVWSLWSPISIIDKASPILLSAVIKDSNLDYIPNRIELTFSENLTWTFSGFSTNTWTILSTTYEAPNKIILWIWNLSITNPNILLNYSWNIWDSNSNLIWNISDYQVSDNIPPKLLNTTTLDQNWNWKIDGIYMNFSETLTWSFWDFNVSVNGYSLASSNIYSFSWSNWVKINLDEKTTSDTNATPQITLNSNTTVKDLYNNSVRAPLNSTSNDWVWPTIIWARFDEWLKNLYLTFWENVVWSLNNSSFVLNNSTSTVVSTSFSSGSNTAVITLSNTWITYWSSEISFSANTVSDYLWNKQPSTYFTKITASVFINEYMNSGNVKYIELKNISSSPVDIWWWTLENASATPITLNSYSLGANSYYLISTNNTYFSWITADQLSTVNITWNIILKNWNIIVDNAYYQTSQSNKSVEKLPNCSNSLSNSCWYEAVWSNWFVNSTYKWTPKSNNIFDATLPTILSSSPQKDTLFPYITSINANFNYEDNTGGVWIDSGSIKLKLEKYNWSTWENYNTVVINTWSITNTNSKFNLTWFNTYWKYRLIFNVSDLAWNEVSDYIIFYLDDFKFNISQSNINLWTLNPWDLKLSDTLVTLQVQTIWAWFSLIHEVNSPNNFPNWDWNKWYWLCIWNTCTTISNFSSWEIIQQGQDVQEDWNLKTYTYDIKYWALINNLQEAWIYNFLNKNKIIINY
jgi:hypothetical protein